MITSIANRTSFSLEEEASHLHDQIQEILLKAHLAVQLLQNITSLQNRSILILDRLEPLRDALEDLSAFGEDRLRNISDSVPFALNEASESLAQVQAQVPLGLNLTAINNTVGNLREETGNARASADAGTSTVQNLNSDFIALSQLASLLLNRSRSIDSEAVVLLERARFFFELAHVGVVEANSIVNQTESLLMELRSNTQNAGVLQEGLMGVIANVDSAERISADVANDISRERILLQQLERDLMNAIEIMERAGTNLQETLKVRTDLCIHRMIGFFKF